MVKSLLGYAPGPSVRLRITLFISSLTFENWKEFAICGFLNFLEDTQDQCAIPILEIKQVVRPIVRGQQFVEAVKKSANRWAKKIAPGNLVSIHVVTAVRFGKPATDRRNGVLRVREDDGRADDGNAVDQ